MIPRIALLAFKTQLMEMRWTCYTKPAATCILLLLASCTWLPTAKEVASDTLDTPFEWLVQRDGKVLVGQQAEHYLATLLSPLDDPSPMRSHLRTEQTVSGAPLVDGNRVELLIDGPQTYAAMFAAIRVARHHVHINAYIFSDDEIGEKLAQLLTGKARAGVRIRVIHDAVGTLATPASFFKDMAAQGVEIVSFNPLDPVKDPLLWRLNHREHSKLLIVDGRIAFTGGINISSVYVENSGRFSSFRTAKKSTEMLPWRDTHLELTGPIVPYLQVRFLDTWKTLTGKEVEDREAYLHSIPSKGETAVRVLDSPANEGELEVYTLYLSAITHARQRLWLTQSYFSPNEEILLALESAAARGVDVQILLPGITDQGLVYHASRSKYGRLLKAGVQLWEFEDRVLHAKTAVVDGIWSTVGSANLDIRSFIHNNELNVSLVSPAFAQQLEKQFQRDLKTATAVTLQAWKTRPFTDRLKEFGSRLLDYWL